MELVDYKKTRLAELHKLQKILEPNKENIAKWRAELQAKSENHAPQAMEGVEESPGETEVVILAEKLKDQKKRMEDVAEAVFDIEEETHSLKAINLTKGAFDLVQETLSEDYEIVKLVRKHLNSSDAKLLLYPQVELNCGFDTSHGIGECMACLCTNGDTVIACLDAGLGSWRIRRFSRLGQLVWDAGLSEPQAEIMGVIEWLNADGSSRGFLMAQSSRGRILHVSTDGEELETVYEGVNTAAPGDMCFNTDRTRLLFTSLRQDGASETSLGKICVLDTRTRPFTLESILNLDFRRPTNVACLDWPNHPDTFVVVSNEKKLLKVIDSSGCERRRTGPRVLGQEWTPTGLTCHDGHVFVVELKTRSLIRFNTDLDVTAVMRLPYDSTPGIPG